MYSGVATGIFAIRNADKTMNENIGRLPVTIGQSASLIKAGAQYADDSKKTLQTMRTIKNINNTDKVFNNISKAANYASKKIKTVLNTLDDIAKSDKVFNGLSKAVNFASNNVNPLIVASSGLNVALADKKDRKKTLIAESGSIAGMFIGEGLMKKKLDGVLNKLPINKKWIPIIKGVVFVAGSITSSSIGQKIGKKIAEYWDKPISQQNTPLVKQYNNTLGYKNLDIKA